MVSRLKTHAKKLNLIVSYFTLIRAFQSSRSKAPPTSTLQPSPHGEEAMLEVWPEGVVEEATS